LDADSPAQGVKLARRNTASASTFVAERKEVPFVAAIAHLARVVEILPRVSEPIIARKEFCSALGLLGVPLWPVMLDISRGIGLKLPLAKTALVMLSPAQSVLHGRVPEYGAVDVKLGGTGLISGPIGSERRTAGASE
jgi:hypothetical protein